MDSIRSVIEDQVWGKIWDIIKHPNWKHVDNQVPYYIRKYISNELKIDLPNVPGSPVHRQIQWQIQREIYDINKL